MHVYLGADHRGFAAKEQVVTILKGRQIPYTDFGAYEYNAEDDYNDFAKKVCQAIIDNNSPDSFGVLLCGSAQGMAMQANRFKGIRAAVCYDQATAIESRGHNDANVACIPADDSEIIIAAVLSAFLTSSALPDEKYKRRNQKLDEI